MKVVLALLCLITLAAARAQPSFAPIGVYLFNTTEQHDGAPVCSELWEFKPDGRMLIESGAERAEHAYRIETDRDGVWLIRRAVRSNGAPDCMGHRIPSPTPQEHRTYLVPMNDGRVATCPAPTRTSDGAPFVSGCYGFMVPADQAG